MAPKKDLTKYTSYFTMEVPSSIRQIAIIVLFGIVAGSISSIMIHYGYGEHLVNVLLLGASSGIMIVSFPALLTVAIIKMMKRNMKIKHVLFAVLAVSGAYSFFLILDSAIFSVLRNDTLSYLILLLVNASIYGYWFIINKIVIGQRRSAIITAEIQPILNVIMYFPFGGYLLRPGFPVEIALVKLYSGIVVFMIMGYAIIYLLDRPAKKRLAVSGIDLFSNMVNQWLYDIAADPNILGKGGVNREVNVDLAVIYGKEKARAVFIKPDIHYGPFGTVGGSVFPEIMSEMMAQGYNITPFIVHGAVNIEDNPMNTNQVYSLSRRISEHIKNMRGGQIKNAYGSVSFGSDRPCRAMNIRINNTNILTLSKAPYVTEDIDREVGMRFADLASRNKSSTLLIDAHNSRFESAGAEELRGIGKSSKYIPKYENAILKATKDRRKGRLSFGSSHLKMSDLLPGPDLGRGFSSVGVFDFGKSRFAMVYIDSNNMLPGFRRQMIGHIKDKYGMEAELCTTDTHSVNSIAMSARNSLGRYTTPRQMIPVMDRMIERALGDMEPARFASSSFRFERFRVWGNGSEELLTKVGTDIISMGKKVVPLLIVGAYIVAGWIIYIM